MRLLLLLQVLLFTVVARAPTAAHAWRKEGHYMVCKIAENFLTSEASAAVAKLLPEWAGGELAATCSWADDERRRYPWSGELHFADTQGDCQFIYDRDCRNMKGEKDMCVVGGINNYTAALMNSSAPSKRATVSLMFLAHFLGDIHQPLHCGSVQDYGGNTIAVNWYNRTMTNLHRVWDQDIIEKAMKDYYGNDLSIMTNVIMLNITENWSDEEEQWEACPSKTKTCADKYAMESAQLACDVAYAGVKQGSVLGDDYFSALPVVRKRIAQGGIRLAAILNRIFGDNNSRLQSI
ncbi:endonuclease 2-like [Miscanthus floridulus]|uniref:endonuclease 2-like n=1 Tax=Miscanthus floridulus TaxID=154761 RepID=UPI0034583087